MKSPKTYYRNTVYSISSSSSSLSSSASIRIKSAWNILTKPSKRSKSSSTSSSSTAFTSSSSFTADRRISNGSSNNSSINTPPSSRTSVTSSSPSSQLNHARKKKWIEKNNAVSQVTVPPFSPTYCRFNEFPYSNFYVKLPNGKWMVRYRSGNRDILGTDEFEGYMI